MDAIPLEVIENNAAARREMLDEMEDDEQEDDDDDNNDDADDDDVHEDSVKGLLSLLLRNTFAKSVVSNLHINTMKYCKLCIFLDSSCA